MPKLINLTAQDLADRLGEVNAMMADLGAEAKGLKAMLQEMIEEGEAVEGAMFRAAHAVSDRKTVDWKAVAAKFNPSRQLVNAHTKVTEVHAIRVSSRVANAA